MFEKLFKRPSAIARQLGAPLASERASFLAQRAEDGAARDTLVRLARELVVVVQELDLTSSYLITLAAVEAAAGRRARQQRRRRRARTLQWSCVFFLQTATAWLRYLGRLCTPEPPPKPFAPLVDAFISYLTHECGLSTATTTNYQWHIERFLIDFSTRQIPFAEVRVEDTDDFHARQGAHWCRVSIASSAKALRAFFWHAEDQGWCRTGIAEAIETPRLFLNETLPAGPVWKDLQQLIPAADSQHPRSIRDRAILLLFAVHGLLTGSAATDDEVVGKVDDPGLKTRLQSQRFPPQQKTAHVKVTE